MIYNSSKNSGIGTAKAIAAYTLLPGFLTRFTDLAPRFGLLAYLMAVIFESIKLLPKGHQFSVASEMHKFRIRDVMAVAANNLHGGFKNADQYIVFGALLCGIILLLLQFVFLFAMIMTKSAEAAIPFVGMFITVDTEIDMAHMMLDKVFGIPGFFNSCFDPAINPAAICAGYSAPATFPTAFQGALQALFKFYSMGILIVATFVIVYFIFAMIIETANTGVPFGSRFQSVFTPLRLVMAVLLLIPLANGYNTGQWIVLLSAKWGSGLATNSWLLFNNRVGDNPMGMTHNQLVGIPKVTDIDSTLNFLYLAHTCRASYKLGIPDTLNAPTTPPSGVTINAYLVRTGSSSAPSLSQQIVPATTFTDARNFAKQGDVQIVFGEKNAQYDSYPGQVKPYCGRIVMPALSKNVPGIVDIYNVYFKNILDIWFNSDMAAYGKRMACVIKFSTHPDCASPAAITTWGAPDTDIAGQAFYSFMRTTFQSNYTTQMNTEINTIRTTANPQLVMDATTLKRGWGGAGLWFDKVMVFNGAMVDALASTPTPTQFPMLMEFVASAKKRSSPNIPLKDIYSPEMPETKNGKTLEQYLTESGLAGSPGQNMSLVTILNDTYKQIQDSDVTTKPKTTKTDNPAKNFVKLLFAESGIFDFRANSEVFPLAKLAMLGRDLINKTVTMLGAKALMQGAGGVMGAELGPIGDAIKSFGPGIGSFATIGLSLGILLYYVLPLMPFIYFFFAVGRWVKSIFEAMVAMPLWALAHLRLGGDGIPGPAAGQGYFLILEIFLRPIFTLFGLMASIATFIALTVGLDTVFNMVVVNVGGYDMTSISASVADPLRDSMREPLDALFYTAIYAILVYMIATSSFKLIDILPNAVMRWGGTNTASFNDQTDPISQVNYNLVYKADAVARDISGQGDNFADKAKNREVLSGK